MKSIAIPFAVLWIVLVCIYVDKWRPVASPSVPRFHAGYALIPPHGPMCPAWETRCYTTDPTDPRAKAQIVSVLTTNVYEEGTEFSDDAIGYILQHRLPKSRPYLDARDALDDYERWLTYQEVNTLQYDSGLPRGTAR